MAWVLTLATFGDGLEANKGLERASRRSFGVSDRRRSQKGSGQVYVTFLKVLLKQF